MKLAYLANVRFPSERAHSVQIAHMCQAFAEKRCTVDLYVNKREHKILDSVINTYGFKSKFEVTRLFPSYIFPNLKFTFYISEFIFTLHFLLNRNKKYDVIYSRSEWIIFFLSFFCSSRRLVWESHEAKLNVVARYILFQRKIKCVVISEGIKDEYLQIKVEPDQLCVAHDAVDSSFFSPSLPNKQSVRTRLGLQNGIKNVMYIGGLDTWKGVGVFCEASTKLENINFVIIGGTLSQLEVYKNKYPNIQFLGQLPYKDLPANQQAADILIIPNTATNLLSSKYTSPLKLFAHATSGIPLVISNVRSLTVVVNELVSTFRPDDPDDLVSVIDSVFENYDYCKLQALQLQRLATDFTWDARAKKILNFIENKPSVGVG